MDYAIIQVEVASVVSVLGVKKDSEACLVHQLSSLKSLEHSLSDRAHLFLAKMDYLSDYDDVISVITSLIALHLTEQIPHESLPVDDIFFLAFQGLLFDQYFSNYYIM